MAENQAELSKKLNLETAKASWQELQTFFAQGLILHVTPSLDLLEVAEQLSVDNSVQFQQWLSEGKVEKVSDKLALDWFQQDVTLWTVVIKPWILVQFPK